MSFPGGIYRHCPNGAGVWKAKAKLEVERLRDMKGNEKGFQK